MIDNLVVKNFKAFKYKEFDQCKRINFLTGLGKTCTLEALNIYKCPSYKTIVEINRLRENKLVPSRYNPQSIWADLFYGTPPSENSKLEIIGQETQGYKNVKERKVTLEIKDNQSLTSLFDLFEKGITNNYQEFKSNLYIELTTDSQDYKEVVLSNYKGPIPYVIQDSTYNSNEECFYLVSSSKSITGVELAFLWDNLRMQNKESRALSLLHTIEDIQSFCFGYEPVLYIKKRNEKLLPFWSHGSSLLMQVYLVLCILACPNKSLILIDGIDHILDDSFSYRLWQSLNYYSEEKELQFWISTKRLDLLSKVQDLVDKGYISAKYLLTSPTL